MMEVARVCREYLRQGAALDVPVFFQWWKRCENYAFVKEKLGDPFTQPATPAPGKKPRKRVQDRAARRSPYPGGFHGSTLFGERGLTLLHVALKHKVPDPVTLAIAEEWPDAAKVKNEHGNTPLHLGLWNSSTKLSVSEKVLVKLIELCPAAVEVKAHNDDGPMSTLIAALSVKDLPPAVVLAILAACPQMAKELKPFNNDTPLHVALETLRGDHYRANSIANILLPAVPKDARDSEKEAAGNALEPASDAIILALIALWPDSVKQVPLDNNENSHFSTPMHYAMVYGASVPVVKAMIDACPEALAIPELESGHLPLHDALESKTTTEAATLLVLDAYPLAANPPAAGGGLVLAEPALHTAFQNTDRNTEAVVRAIAAAAPEMCQSVGYRGNDDDDASETILHMAVKGTPSNQMVQLAVELWPGAVGMKTRVQTGLGRFDGVTYGGNTPLHELALWNEERQDYVTAADFRSKNDICYTLAGAGASVTARNAAGDTADEASHKSVFYGKPSEGAAEGNRHLRATLHEIEMYTSLPHLGLMHFRDWTSVSHAWCTPSAKLTALTVLLVGCSFKRLDSEWKLPRLPMDCWYRILNMIPRHELRMGNFTAESELAAEAQYTAILASGTAKKSTIVFPVVFSIGGAYNRRESALAQYGSMKAHLRCIFMATRDWVPEKDKEAIKRAKTCLGDLLGASRALLCGHRDDVQNNEAEVYKCFTAVSRFIRDDLRNANLATGECSRCNQYLSKTLIAFENCKHIYQYRTPQTLRAFSDFFIIVFPPLYGPYFAFVATNEDSSQSAGLAYFMPVLFSLLLVSLDQIQAYLENPFDQVGEDDIVINAEKFLRTLVDIDGEVESAGF